MNTEQAAKKYESLCTELAKLRLNKEQAEAKFLLRLREVEETEMDLLRTAGCETFDRFLKSTKLMDSARYRSFVAGLEKIGPERALEIGAEATIEASAVLDGEATVKKYTAAVLDWRQEHRGVFPSAEVAAHILRQVEPREEIPQASRTQSEVRRLKNRIAELEAENAKLRAEIARLKDGGPPLGLKPKRPRDGGRPRPSGRA